MILYIFAIEPLVSTMRNFLLTALFIPATIFLASGQKIRNSSEIMEDLQKLKVLGSVLYVAAHPDDENTRLITYLSKGRHFRTAYISLTRGDGGQNLIGDELDEYLGVIRTQELVEARKIDGGTQYFSRANDFGYSKNAEETFSIWDRDSILADVLKVVRTFKPDVIINRFDHRTSGRTHGHHTASAILGLDAFKYCNSPLTMREVLKNTEPHQVQRIYFNTSFFFYGREKFDTMDKSFLYQLDAGPFYPAYGASNNEIASLSRSMHKSQGFGINSSRGTMTEYFERLDAPKPNDETDPFDGLDLSWTRINGGGNVDKVLDEIIRSYDYKNPWKSMALLQKAERYMEELPDHHWKQIKLNEIRSIIADCAGIYAEAFTDQQMISAQSKFRVHTEFIVRNPVDLEMMKIEIPKLNFDSSFQTRAVVNKAYTFQKDFELPAGLSHTAPFWLLKGRPNNYYQTSDSPHGLLPNAPKELNIHFRYKINNKEYEHVSPLVYKNDDPVLGEVKEGLDILPSSVVLADDPNFLIRERKAVCSLRILSTLPAQDVLVNLVLPVGVKCPTSDISLHFEKAGETKYVVFELQITDQTNEKFEIPVHLDHKQGYFYKSIKYPHIQKQNVLTPAKIQLIHAPKVHKPKRIAYVEGAGDFIDEALIKSGHQVYYLAAAELDQLLNKKFDVLVFGIRALNNRDELKHCKKYITPFIEQGGKVIMQYNTTADLVTTDFAPAELKIGRGRVTNENAEVTILKPEHPVFNSPDKISHTDFQNWVQERGLYFPSTYDRSYEELLSMQDGKENPQKSALLIRKTGQGHFIYTSLSFFRQLKAGVPGAYRLFNNLVSFE